MLYKFEEETLGESKPERREKQMAKVNIVSIRREESSDLQVNA